MATNLIALDVGEQRVGVSLVRAEIRLASTMPTLMRSAPDFWEQLVAILKEYAVSTVVVGLPRGLEGQDTSQTKYVKDFGEELTQRFGVTIVWQDEALTSREAERLLQESGRPYAKGDIDAQAARLILEDYLASNPEAIA